MNRRRLLSLFAAMALAGPLAGGGLAAAQERGREGRGREDRGRDRGGEQQRGRGEDRGRGYERGGGYERGRGDGGRGDDRGERWRDRDRSESRREYEAPPRAARAPEERPSQGRSGRRGGYMPPDYRGEALGDPGRYRLRPAPRGYAWYRVGGGYALVDERSGQIFDVIPD